MNNFKHRNGSDIFKRSIQGIEQFYEQVRKGATSSKATISPNILHTNFKYEIINKYLKFLYALHQAKYTELTGSLIESVNNKEYLIFALCGRSLLELTASLRYHTNDLLPIIQDSAKSGIVTSQQQIMLVNNLDKHIRGGKFNWGEFHYGDRSSFAAQLVEDRKKKNRKNKQSEPPPSPEQANPNQVNIQTAIDKWAKEDSGVQLTYDYFCELVHPNLGSNFLVMGSNNKELIIGKNSPKDVAENLCLEGVPMIASTAIREGAKYMGLLSLLKETDDVAPSSETIN